MMVFRASMEHTIKTLATFQNSPLSNQSSCPALSIFHAFSEQHQFGYAYIMVIENESTLMFFIAKLMILNVFLVLFGIDTFDQT